MAYNSHISSPMPGFTAEQTASLQVMITTAIHDAVTQAISQAMTAFETRQQQSIVEKTAEKTTENKSTGSSSDNDNTGTLSTIPHQATMHYCRESSPRLNGAPLSTLASQLASQLASPPDYIHYAKGMEATGQG